MQAAAQAVVDQVAAELKEEYGVVEESLAVALQPFSPPIPTASGEFTTLSMKQVLPLLRMLIDVQRSAEDSSNPSAFSTCDVVMHKSCLTNLPSAAQNVFIAFHQCMCVRHVASHYNPLKPSPYPHNTLSLSTIPWNDVVTVY